jgi:hypothetical protein
MQKFWARKFRIAGRLESFWKPFDALQSVIAKFTAQRLDLPHSHFCVERPSETALVYCLAGLYSNLLSNNALAFSGKQLAHSKYFRQPSPMTRAIRTTNNVMPQSLLLFAQTGIQCNHYGFRKAKYRW